jgi:hypothetical protein
MGEWRYSSTHSLTSALDKSEWSASRPGCFTPRDRARGTRWIVGWVGPRTVLDAVVKRKIPNPCRESNPRTPIVQPVAQRYTDWALTAYNYLKLANEYWNLGVLSSLSFHILSKTLKIKIHRTRFVHFICFGWETWSLNIRQEYIFKMFENRIIRRISESKKKAGESCIIWTS